MVSNPGQKGAGINQKRVFWRTFSRAKTRAKTRTFIKGEK